MNNEMTTDNMSNEEAVEVLKGIVFNGFDRTTREERQALHRAIQALETGEIYIDGEDYNFFIRGYKEGLIDFARPKGKWIFLNTDEVMKVECPFCHRRKCCISNYCDCCGADMRGSKKETTFDDYLKEQLKDPEFRKEWDKLCNDDMQKGDTE